jgi:hypothetical protein
MARDIAFSNSQMFAGAEVAAPRASLLQRAADWLAVRRNARQESEIERFISERGGVLNDNIERQIAQRFAHGEHGRY